MGQALFWYPEMNSNTTWEASVLGYSSTSRHTPSTRSACGHGSADQHQDWGNKEREGPESVRATTRSFLWVSRTQGPVETSPLCWEQGAHVAQQGQGWAGRQHFQGFLPSIMPRSVQPKSICSEGVESHQHKQEALSKKASSVLLRRCNHVRNTKRHRHLQKSRRWL